MKQSQNLEKKIRVYLFFTSHEPTKKYICEYPDHPFELTRKQVDERDCFVKNQGHCCPYLRFNYKEYGK